MSQLENTIRKLETLQTKLDRIRRDFKKLEESAELQIDYSPIDIGMAKLEEFISLAQSGGTESFLNIVEEDANSVVRGLSELGNKLEQFYATAIAKREQYASKLIQSRAPTMSEESIGKYASAIARGESIEDPMMLGSGGKSKAFNVSSVRALVNQFEKLPVDKISQIGENMRAVNGHINKTIPLFENLHQILPGQGSQRAITFFENLSKSLVLTKEDAKTLSSIMKQVIQDIKNYTSQPITAEKAKRVVEQGKSALMGAGFTANVAGQGIGSGINIDDLKPTPPKLKFRLTGDIENAERMIQDARESTDGFNNVVGNLVRDLARLVKESQGAATEIRSIGAEANGTTEEIKLLYSTINKEEGITSYASGLEATANLRTGKVTGLSKPVQATGKANVEFLQNNVEYVKNLYREAYTQQDRMISKIKSMGDVEILSDRSKMNIDETTGAIEIMMKYIDRTSDKAGVLREQIENFSAERVGNAVELSSPTTRLEGARQLFSDDAAVKFERNLNDALQDTKLTTENVTTAVKDYASGLTRVSVAKEELRGISENITLIFNKEGQLVKDTSQRYKGFAASLKQAINRVFRYAIAANLIYRTMNRMQEIPAIMANIEQSMNRIVNLSNISSDKISGFFNTAVDVAERYGFQLEEVLSSAETSLQAVGGADTDQAMVLLGDAMLFAKISGESLEESIDNLVASLSQMGMDLTEGRALMESWIVLSRQFRVGISDLSEVFATAGSMATEVLAKDVEDATNQLNALITVAEKSTPLSSRQLGSFFKTIFSSLTSSEVVQDLKVYGIQVEDVAGKQRNLYDVMRDIYSLTTQYEAAGSGALSAIASRAGRGGSRQAAYFAALIENWEEVEEARRVSENAALNYEQFITDLTDNLQDDIAKLKLAFSDLLVTLGDEGLSEFLSETVKSLTELAKGMSSLADSVGPTAAKLGLMVGKVLLLTQAIQKLQGISQFQALVSGQMGVMGVGEAAIGKVGTYFSDSAEKTSTFTKYGMTIGAALITGIQSAIEGNDAAVVAGETLVSAIGTGVGAALGGVPGAMIGNQISEFINDTISKQRDAIASATEAATEGDIGRLYEEAPTNMLRGGEKNLRLQAFRSVYGTSPSGRNLGDSAILSSLGDKERLEKLKNLYIFSDKELSQVEAANTVYKQLLDYHQQRVEAVKEEEKSVEEEIQIVNRTLQRYEELGQKFGDFETYTEFTESDQFATGLNRIKSKAFQRFAVDETLSRRQFTEITEPQGLLEQSTNSAKIAYDVMSDYFDKIGADFMDVVETFAFGGKEMATYVGGVVGEVSALRSQAEEGTVSWDEYSKRQEEVIKLYQLMEKRASEVNVPDTMPGFLDWRDTTPDVRKRAIEMAKAAQQEFAKLLGWTEEQYEAWKENLDPVYLQLDDTEFEELEEKLDTRFLSDFMSQLQEESGGIDEAFNIRRLSDVGPERFGEIQELSRYWTEYIANLRGMSSEQYMQQEGEQFNLVMGPNNTLRQINSTAEAMNFVLQDILETEKKQLEGMWNIPEGATFWVPITSAFQQGGGNQMNYPTLPERQLYEEGPSEDILSDDGTFSESTSQFAAAVDSFSKLAQPFNQLMDDRPKDKITFEEIYDEGFGKIERAAPDRYDEEHPSTYLPELLKGWDRETIRKDDLLKRDYAGMFSEKSAKPSQVSVTVPEPKSFEVESTLNTTINLDGSTVARVVRRVLSRELNRKYRQKTYSVPLGKV